MRLLTPKGAFFYHQAPKPRAVVGQHVAVIPGPLPRTIWINSFFFLGQVVLVPCDVRKG